ncbi:MAG: carboxypeptidase-like regulatory domain-containing protein, partial [Bacteroidales bacterium]|nr:carboxypeptidase-like regulatory domain-containing protein [Bacteroidales bacterium]
MKKTIYILLLALLGFSAANAQNIIKGVLLDANKGEAIPFAQVFLEGTNHWASTDLNGYFIINK